MITANTYLISVLEASKVTGFPIRKWIQWILCDLIPSEPELNAEHIKLDDIAKNKLLQRIHQIKRGGLGVAIDILFRVLLVTVPDMKDFYQALVSDVEREDALKLISHKDAIRITEDVLLGAMSMQR